MTSVRNMLAIAGKELRGYFASPMGYILIGLFALLFGAFFHVYLTGFAEQSQRMAMGGGAGNINVNEYLIRGVLHNVAIIILFVMPLVTMRTYAEEKRSGTMELLLTSPITDLADHRRQVPRRDGTLRGHAARHRDRHRDSLPPRQPRAQAGVDRLSRAAAARRLLPVGGPVPLEPDQEPDRRRRAHVRRVPDALDHQLVRRLGRARPGVSIVGFLSITEHLDDFTKGIIDTKHLVYYLSFITFGLFLTAKSVDSERWRG